MGPFSMKSNLAQDLQAVSKVAAGAAFIAVLEKGADDLEIPLLDDVVKRFDRAALREGLVEESDDFEEGLGGDFAVEDLLFEGACAAQGGDVRGEELGYGVQELVWEADWGEGGQIRHLAGGRVEQRFNSSANLALQGQFEGFESSDYLRVRSSQDPSEYLVPGTDNTSVLVLPKFPQTPTGGAAIFPTICPAGVFNAPLNNFDHLAPYLPCLPYKTATTLEVRLHSHGLFLKRGYELFVLGIATGKSQTHVWLLERRTYVVPPANAVSDPSLQVTTAPLNPADSLPPATTGPDPRHLPLANAVPMPPTNGLVEHPQILTSTTDGSMNFCRG
ncbi:hypothetical protein BDK51DRAFT_32932 [Blyttiomyces helicus]|uniref:Uncharacterized protein n=1 Tax=Blyttiomyces helicus TaxID=388810 RepID=A0A4P9WKD1_9FUNG|nr:hypothetical protein BDK51DRAFT_32932 [Blyttiomyces helicus]|eukprot:RKO91620.1 hypothetical protein BDK51DRAFT_32932 [Blyttiomyces helicus]